MTFSSCDVPKCLPGQCNANFGVNAYHARNTVRLRADSLPEDKRENCERDIQAASGEASSREFRERLSERIEKRPPSETTVASYFILEAL